MVNQQFFVVKNGDYYVRVERNCNDSDEIEFAVKINSATQFADRESAQRVVQKFTEDFNLKIYLVTQSESEIV